MKIYVASSWRNPFQQHVVKELRDAGHQVYDFKNPSPGDNGFHWSEIDPEWQDWGAKSFKEALSHEIAEAGFASDMNALKECDACVMVLPCGASAHLELGWAVGAGKATAVLLRGAVMLKDAERIGGHSWHPHAPCSVCGDLDGCHQPAKMKKFEPELMYKMVNLITDNLDMLKHWLKRGAHGAVSKPEASAVEEG